LSAGAKAKSVTNNLPILSVLWARPFLFVSVPENCLGIVNLFFLIIFLVVLLQ